MSADGCDDRLQTLSKYTIAPLIFTAYLIDYEWRKKKFIKEYEEYIKSKERQ